MYEVIQEALIWIMSGVLDRQPQGGEALRMLLLAVFPGIATWAGVYWRGLAFRSTGIRRRLLPGERYAGQYLQAVRRGDEVRYVIVHIYYNRSKSRFEALGRNYNSSGEQTSSFKSNYMIFPSDKDDNIEFIWQGSRAASGYTRMTVENPDGDYIEGDGYVIVFGAKPKAFPILFKHLHGRHVRDALGIAPPTQAGEEGRFIRKFHAKLGGAVKEAFEGAAEEV